MNLQLPIMKSCTKWPANRHNFKMAWLTQSKRGEIHMEGTNHSTFIWIKTFSGDGSSCKMPVTAPSPCLDISSQDQQRVVVLVSALKPKPENLVFPLVGCSLLSSDLSVTLALIHFSHLQRHSGEISVAAGDLGGLETAVKLGCRPVRGGMAVAPHPIHAPHCGEKFGGCIKSWSAFSVSPYFKRISHVKSSADFDAVPTFSSSHPRKATAKSKIDTKKNVLKHLQNPLLVRINQDALRTPRKEISPKKKKCHLKGGVYASSMERRICFNSSMGFASNPRYE